MYRSIIRPLLFLFQPETVHHLTFSLLRLGLCLAPVRWLFRKMFVHSAHPALQTQAFGLTFPNPVGLAAGFDKDGLLADRWKFLGFGFVEVGTVTPRPQPGNPRPRLFRLPADQAIINRMGFNNAGVDALADRLSRADRNGIIIGANIGKNKDTPNEQAADDYAICFEKLYPYVDYFVVNVSSPNTPGLRDLQERGPLTALLQRLQDMNHAHKPLLLKIAPDLTDTQLDDIVAVARDTQLAGLVANNTTISREGLATPAETVQTIGAGGLSGKPVTQRSAAVLNYLRTASNGQIPIIGVGGIMTPQDAADRLQAGAVLVQTYTGFIYAGPGFARAICSLLAK